MNENVIFVAQNINSSSSLEDGSSDTMVRNNNSNNNNNNNRRRLSSGGTRVQRILERGKVNLSRSKSELGEQHKKMISHLNRGKHELSEQNKKLMANLSSKVNRKWSLNSHQDRQQQQEQQQLHEVKVEPQVGVNNDLDGVLRGLGIDPLDPNSTLVNTLKATYIASKSAPSTSKSDLRRFDFNGEPKKAVLDEFEVEDKRDIGFNGQHFEIKTQAILDEYEFNGDNIQRPVVEAKSPRLTMTAYMTSKSAPSTSKSGSRNFDFNGESKKAVLDEFKVNDKHQVGLNGQSFKGKNQAVSDEYKFNGHNMQHPVVEAKMDSKKSILAELDKDKFDFDEQTNLIKNDLERRLEQGYGEIDFIDDREMTLTRSSNNGFHVDAVNNNKNNSSSNSHHNNNLADEIFDELSKSATFNRRQIPETSSFSYGNKSKPLFASTSKLMTSDVTSKRMISSPDLGQSRKKYFNNIQQQQQSSSSSSNKMSEIYATASRRHLELRQKRQRRLSSSSYCGYEQNHHLENNHELLDEADHHHHQSQHNR